MLHRHPKPDGYFEYIETLERRELRRLARVSPARAERGWERTPAWIMRAADRRFGVEQPPQGGSSE